MRLKPETRRTTPKRQIAKGLSELVQARQETARTVFKFVSQTSAGQPASGHGSA